MLLQHASTSLFRLAGGARFAAYCYLLIKLSVDFLSYQYHIFKPLG